MTIEQIFEVTTGSSEFQAGFDTAIQRLIAYLEDSRTPGGLLSCAANLRLEFQNRKQAS